MDDAADVIRLPSPENPPPGHVLRGLLEDRRQDGADALGERRQLACADALGTGQGQRVGVAAIAVQKMSSSAMS